MEFKEIRDRMISVNEIHVLRRRKLAELDILNAILDGRQRYVDIVREDIEYFGNLGYTIALENLVLSIDLYEPQQEQREEI